MSYFRVIVDKDKFSLYDTSKDKYYTVEPDDIDHILDSENPYNDDGSLNLKSYSDVINYFNRKKPGKQSKALTKGYTSKKANLKKEYQSVNIEKRKKAISKKLANLNISKIIKKKIADYPMEDIIETLDVDETVKTQIKNALKSVDETNPLNFADEIEIYKQYVKNNPIASRFMIIKQQDRNRYVNNRTQYNLYRDLLTETRARREVLNQRLRDLRENNAEASNTDEIESVLSSIESADRRINELNEERERVKRDIDEYEEKYDDRHDSEKQQDEEQINLKNKINEIKRETAENERKIKKAERKIAENERMNDAIRMRPEEYKKKYPDEPIKRKHDLDPKFTKVRNDHIPYGRRRYKRQPTTKSEEEIEEENVMKTRSASNSEDEIVEKPHANSKEDKQELKDEIIEKRQAKSEMDDEEINVEDFRYLIPKYDNPIILTNETTSSDGLYSCLGIPYILSRTISSNFYK